MSEIRDRDEFLLTVNRLMICAMEDIDCGRNEAGPTTLDLVQRIEDHDAALRAENERLGALARFGSEMLREWWDDGNIGDIDGGQAQEAAEAHGLWHQVERHADGIECEWCGNEGPCGELTEAGLAALAAPPEEKP